MVFTQHRQKDPWTRIAAGTTAARLWFTTEPACRSRGKGRFIGYVVLVRLHILVDTFNVTTASRHTQKPGWTAELNVKGKTVVSLENKCRMPLRIQWRTYKALVKAKMEQFDHIKFYISSWKDTIKRTRRQAQRGRGYGDITIGQRAQNPEL